MFSFVRVETARPNLTILKRLLKGNIPHKQLKTTIKNNRRL